MADSNRPKGGEVSRRMTFRRPRREAVPAQGTRDFDPRFGDGPGDEGGTGSAGVREPRHPKPLGPLADARELPQPEPPRMVVLPDPRR